MNKSFLYDVQSSVGTHGADRYVRFDQEIPDEFLQSLKQQRDASTKSPAGEMHRVASIPVAVVEKWLREGFNIYEAPAKDIIKRLHAEGLEAFMATNKRI